VPQGPERSDLGTNATSEEEDRRRLLPDVRRPVAGKIESLRVGHGVISDESFHELWQDELRSDPEDESGAKGAGHARGDAQGRHSTSSSPSGGGAAPPSASPARRASDSETKGASASGSGGGAGAGGVGRPPPMATNAAPGSCVSAAPSDGLPSPIIRILRIPRDALTDR
jgi:hypothetical protein